jgi:hypothetical protein
MENLLAEAAGFPMLFLRTDPSPWTTADLLDGRAAQTALDLVSSLTREWPALRVDLERLATEGGLSAPRTLASALALTTLATEVNATLSLFDPGLFDQDLAALATALEPAVRGRLSAFLSWVGRGGYRRARRTLCSLRLSPAEGSAGLAREAAVARDQLEQWQGLSAGGSHPRLLSDAERLGPELDRFAERVGECLRSGAGGTSVESPSTASAAP